MNVRKYTSGLAASALLASGLALAVGAPASADPTFTADATSIVGVGSDTIEFVVGDLAAGKDINGVHVAGWNDTHATQKIASYNATGTTPVALRTGSTPVARPNGSGQGKATLFGAGNNASPVWLTVGKTGGKAGAIIGPAKFTVAGRRRSPRGGRSAAPRGRRPWPPSAAARPLPRPSMANTRLASPCWSLPTSGYCSSTKSRST